MSYLVPHTVYDDDGKLLAVAGTPMEQSEASERGVIAAVKKLRDDRKAKQKQRREATNPVVVATEGSEGTAKTEVASTRKGAK
jgi:hypothetical protein